MKERGPENMAKKEGYVFSDREPYWQQFWERERVYEFDPNSNKPLYTIDTPPPTISGSLHLGHIYSYTQAEVVSRFKRMAGHNVRYPFGYDDNGLPTERLVEKELDIKGQDQGLREFRQSCLGVVRKYADEYKNLWQSIGMSVDWRLEYSTISDEVQKISQATFKRLYERGLIYKQEAPALYCHECLTSIAQAEVEDQERPSVFYDIAFSTEGGGDLVISTTRPELIPACVAVFVNPTDKRYQKLVGQKIKTPLGDEVEVLADELVSTEKGTGAVMCCTYGDETDLHWVRKHNLASKVVINENGSVGTLENAPYLEGLSIVEARSTIVDRLKQGGYMRGEREITHAVGVHERCETPVEIIPRSQWFVRILDAKDDLIEAGNKINWYPRHMRKRYRDWVENLKWDWCISRERFFGIPIPAYTCDDCQETLIPDEDKLPIDPRGESAFQTCPHCSGSSISPETTVFDTWFTSALTPEINSQHSLNGHLQGKMLPMSMRPQAHDIIRTWAVYTTLMSLYNHDEIPWEDLMISGHVLVKKGEKISKKTGGGKYKPQDLIARHSADAIRYAMCQATIGKDSYYEDEQARSGRKLVTKLLNAGRFSLANLQDFDPTSTQISGDQPVATDRWIIQRMKEASSRMAREFEKYEFSRALSEFEKFFWDDFADNYLELVKGRLYDSENTEARTSAQYALYQTYLGILKMASPFVPHITEEMYHSDYIQTGERVFQGHLESSDGRGYFHQFERANSIHVTPWVEFADEERSDEITTGVSLMLGVVSEVRKFKSERKMKLSSPLETLVIRCDTPEKKAAVEAFVIDITSVSKAAQVVVTTSDDRKDYQAVLEIKL